LADRVRRPLVIYGVIELAVGATGFVIPWLLFHLAPLWVHLHDALGGTGPLLGGVRFALAFGVLMVPSLRE